jgi:hypothetical protein
MAYVYRVSFSIQPEIMDQLEVGSSLERVLGYLRALLPGEPGHMGTRALYAIGEGDQIEVVVESTWGNWQDLELHRRSLLAENKVLNEFEPHVELHDLTARVYGEVD